MLLTRAFHEDRGETRTKVLTPDTAHGTNPATVTMAGYEVVKVGTDAQGNVDLDDLRAKATDDVACLMLTNPSTLGLFEHGIEEIAQIVHDVGATLYYDGANLNAIMGICRPGDMGFDIVHFNLHKSFTQPHGGGGPGAGPIAVADRIEPFLPRPAGGAGIGPTDPGGDDAVLRPGLRPAQVDRAAARASRATTACSCAPTPTSARSARRVCATSPRSPCSTPTTCWPGCAPRACSSTCRWPTTGICMHEFVLSGAPMKRDLQIRTLDLAKRLLDHGVHPPTVYFPLLVDEALLIEPTETETKETLDRFAADPGRDPARGGRGPRDRPHRAAHHAGAPARRGRGGAPAGRAPAALSVPRSDAAGSPVVGWGPCDSSSSAPAPSAARWVRGCTRPGTPSR